MQPRRPQSKFRIFLFLLFIGILTAGFWQRQNLFDWWQLHGYQAPASVAQLASNTTMSDKGRRIFYVQHPAVQEKATFYVSCEEGETAVVLGCYKPNKGIYLLKVDDTRLAGVEEVTAAHEMLHAAYARLDVPTRNHINNLLEQTYKGLTDPNITQKIDLYKQSGADIDNELHSILGTEAANLPDELETYYSQYFSNRHKIVSYAAQYLAVFTDRKNRVDQLDAQLSDIENQVIANNASLDAQEKAINTESNRLDSLLRNNQIDEYNQGVAAYNQSLQPFRALLAQTKALVAQYKTLLAERNQVAAEAQELSRALDSRIQTTVTDK
jgi:hypothetical protein